MLDFTEVYAAISADKPSMSVVVNCSYSAQVALADQYSGTALLPHMRKRPRSAANQAR